MGKWHAEVQKCTKCDISAICGPKITLRRNLPVQYLDLLFVGEAPGASEHITRMPFVGPSGDELHNIIAEAAENTPLRYNIINSVLCTPFADSDLDTIRTPLASEIHQCSRHLSAIIKLTTPKRVIAVGKIAARTLKHLQVPFAEIVHPAAILASSHPTLEHNRAVLIVKQAIKDISNAASQKANHTNA